MGKDWHKDLEKTKYPGIFRTPSGYRIRVRTTDQRTGMQREANRAFDGISLNEALAKRTEMLAELQAESGPEKRQRFESYVVSLTERKLAANEINSEATKSQWSHVLDAYLLPHFGQWYVDQIRRSDVEDWKTEQAKLGYSPHTVNNRLRTLLSILRAACVDLELEHDPTRGVKPLDTSAHQPYTEEEPNALTAEELSTFLAAARKLVPQHYAFLALGFATGRRPSELRPLRRKGPTPDIIWSEGVMLVRRSETRGVAMAKTKTGVKLRIPLPWQLIEILRWHVRTLPPGPMRESVLLFPSDIGGYRSSTCLTKPIAKVCKEVGIRKHITPRAMRRTFQDLARASAVHDLVTRAISGHATAEMQGHYSTVDGREVRSGLERVIALAGLAGTHSPGGDRGGYQAPANENRVIQDPDSEPFIPGVYGR